jgi:hypothetical protein
MKEWIGKYDPEEFDIEKLNAKLSNRFGLPKLRKKATKKAAKKTKK